MSWPVCNLGELVKIETGKLDANAAKDDGIYPFFTCSRNTLQIDQYAFDADAIVVAGNGDLNVKHYRGKFNAYQRTYVLTPKNAPMLDSRFLYYFMDKYVERLRELSIGGVIKYIKLGMLADAVIPLPPIEEQKRIAGILDRADAIRRKRQQAIQIADEFLRSIFLDMFGDPITNPKAWRKTTLPKIADTFTDGPFGSNLKSSHYTSNGVRVIRLQNIGVGYLSNDDLAFISEAHFNSLPRNHCQPGDVIIGTLGEPNLRACVVPRELVRSLNKADCLLFRPSKTYVLPEYICWLLNCPSTVDNALNLVRGQTRGRISLGRLKEMEIPVPPLDLQTQFAKIVNTTQRSIVTLHKYQAKLDALIGSLRFRAFSGDL